MFVVTLVKDKHTYLEANVASFIWLNSVLSQMRSKRKETEQLFDTRQSLFTLSWHFEITTFFKLLPINKREKCVENF